MVTAEPSAQTPVEPQPELPPPPVAIPKIHINWFKLLLLSGLCGLIIYTVHIFVVSQAQDLSAIYAGPILGIIAGIISLKLIAKIPIYRAFVISIAAFEVHYLTVPFGLPADDERYLLVMFALIMAIYTVIFTVASTIIGTKKKYLDVILPFAVWIIVMPIAQGIHLSIADQKIVKDVDNITFQLYKPSIVPETYKVSLSRPYVKHYDEDQESYYRINFSSTTGKSYSVFEQVTPSFYNPPDDCGKGEPEFPSLGHKPNQCKKIGASPAGCNIYVYRPDWTNMQAGYCEMGGTLVTLWFDTNILSDNQIEVIFNGLQKSDSHSLLNLGPH